MAHSAAAVPLGALEQGCPIRVEHDRRRRQFTVRLNGCHDRAVLLYEYVGKRIVDLQHTEVPDAYRGRGIAKHLAKAALDFVVEEDLKAHLTCWYIQKHSQKARLGAGAGGRHTDPPAPTPTASSPRERSTSAGRFLLLMPNTRALVLFAGPAVARSILLAFGPT
ncbi:protein NATD1 isoform X3 [Marmota flaviventris]|nr:protein NATD1 isoform X3 [Marmota flaviventris]